LLWRPDQGASLRDASADGAGLVLADQDGTLHIVTGTDQAEQTFERAERDLGAC
jgi:hypothetical protein